MNRGRRGLAARTVEILTSGADLMVPTVCGGCDAPGVPWCDGCAAVLADTPVRLEPRVEVGVDAWALGRYRGPYRGALISVKEHGRRDLCAPLGLALARGIATLAHWEELPDTNRLTLIPAPTRSASARRRGGDHATAIARATADQLGPRVRVADLLFTAMGARDSAGLDARERVANLSGSIRVRGSRTHLLRQPIGTAILVDDILTTGATAAESARVLAAHGVTLNAVMVVAGA